MAEKAGRLPSRRESKDGGAPRPVGETSGEGGRVLPLINRKPVHMIFTGILMVVGGVIGCLLAKQWVGLPMVKVDAVQNPAQYAFNLSCMTIIGLLLGFLLASATFRKIVDVVPRIERMSVEDKVAGVFGLMLGLVVAVLLQPLMNMAGSLKPLLVVVIYLFSVSAGVLFGISMKKELVRMFATTPSIDPEEEAALIARQALPKLLDTNIVIDGRILEVWNSGFVEGDLLVPQFVLDELQTIADSADDLKRARGRRGLDLLNRLKEEVVTFRVLRPRDYAVPVNDHEGVDSKLVKLASAMDAALLTNDFNLSKVAELQGIPVLNVNRLALALKPVVMAGEELRVNIIRHGRDPGQGVAYLDDGTMVVVEDGDPKIGRVVDVVVTSMLQTVAGKMIFAVLKDGHEHRAGGTR